MSFFRYFIYVTNCIKTYMGELFNNWFFNIAGTIHHISNWSRMFIFSDFPYCFGESTKKYKLWNFSGFSEKKFSDHKKAPKLFLVSIRRRCYSYKKLMLVILAIWSLYRSLNFFFVWKLIFGSCSFSESFILFSYFTTF